MTIDTRTPHRGQAPNPFLTAGDENAALSTAIGLARVRKALSTTIDLWDVSPPDARRWNRVFRRWLAELEEAVR